MFFGDRPTSCDHYTLWDEGSYILKLQIWGSEAIIDYNIPTNYCAHPSFKASWRFPIIIGSGRDVAPGAHKACTTLA